MALEPYDPCPCGNGKKFKFCCQPIIEELTAVERLIAEKQPKQALLAAEKLGPEHATNPLLLRNKIMALLMLERHEEAHALIHLSQQANPQDPYGYYFDIRWHLFMSDWDSTRPLVEGHLSSIGDKNPGLAYQLAIEIVDELLNSGRFMAVWRYLFDALLWARNEEDARYVMSAFHELNKSSDIPLPFRNLYQLRTLPDSQPNQAEFAEAMKFAGVRNWTKAAQLFEALSEKDP
ncbi:MAG: motif domain protein, partial [Planctomycetaceae bacterium]|nr:motif domain protein [Planctomycetaceae bacterium]